MIGGSSVETINSIVLLLQVFTPLLPCVFSFSQYSYYDIGGAHRGRRKYVNVVVVIGCYCCFDWSMKQLVQNCSWYCL